MSGPMPGAAIEKRRKEAPALRQLIGQVVRIRLREGSRGTWGMQGQRCKRIWDPQSSGQSVWGSFMLQLMEVVSASVSPRQRDENMGGDDVTVVQDFTVGQEFSVHQPVEGLDNE